MYSMEDHYIETGISACESCVSSGAWRHAPQIILFILNALKSLLIYFYCFFLCSI